MQKIVKLSVFVIIAVVLFVVSFPFMGYAECDGVYVSSNTVTNYTFSDTSLWAISNNQFVIGKKNPSETVPILLPQNPDHKYVRGCVETGLIREKTSMKTAIGSAICGFTKLNAVVVIKTEYIEAVKEIVQTKLNENELSANKIIACTMWWEGDIVSHIFFTSESMKVAVGHIVLNDGKDVVILYMGDFDGDGSMELGFTAGWNTEPVLPEPTPTPTPAVKSQQTKKCCGGKAIQINIFSIVNNCFKFFFCQK